MPSLHRHIISSTRSTCDSLASKCRQRPLSVGFRQCRTLVALARTETDLLPATALPTVPGAPLVASRLQQIRQLLSAEYGGSSEWVDKVESAQRDLLQPRQPSIGVYGGTYSGAPDLVSALIRDALTDKDVPHGAVLERHLDSRSDALEIRYGTSLERNGDKLLLPSAWLAAHQFTIKEVQAFADGVVDILSTSDINVLVLDPIYLLDIPGIRDIVPILAPHSKIIFAVNGRIPPGESETSLSDRLRAQLESFVAAGYQPLSIRFIRADLAVSALEAFGLGLQEQLSVSSRSAAVETFQKNYETSNIGHLRADIVAAVRGLPEYQAKTAWTLGQMALAYLDRRSRADQVMNEEAKSTIDALRSTATRGAFEARHTSVIQRGIEGGVVEGGVAHSLASTQRGIDHLFRTRWTWLNLIAKIRADEIGPELGAHIESHFGKDLERSLVFEAGQLAHLQRTLGSETDSTLHRLVAYEKGSHPLSSPLLLNHLQTLTLSIPPFEADSLLRPVALRKRQLIAETVARMHTSAQRILLSTLSISSSGVALAWFAHVPPLSEISGTTAFGLGLLSVVGSLLLGQRWWAKAQHRFWMDWNRITSMLHGDLRVTLNEAIDTRLIIKPMAAADGMEKVIARREERIERLLATVARLRALTIP